MYPRMRKPVSLLILSLSILTGGARNYTFDGCRDINGIAVASVSNMTIQDIAMATIYNGHSVIFYNPNVLAGTRHQTRLFFYAHECGHHALGHTLSGLRLGQKQEADCWEIQTLKKRSLISDRDISIIETDIARYGRGDWTHLPGPQREISLRTCLSDIAPLPPTKGHWEVTQCTHPAHPNRDRVWIPNSE